jgi:hypothetical protein
MKPEAAASPRPARTLPGLPMAILVLAGLVLRVMLAAAHGAYGGDPLFSYQYRATLLAAGHIEGALLMWHPPGYPMLLALAIALSAHTVSSYVAGVFISIASTGVLVWLVDRLVRPYVARPEFRLVAAALVLFNESLVHWQSAALSEPPYLAAIAGVLVLLHESLAARRVFLAGALAGAATLLRFDGAAIAGCLALLVWYRAGFTRALLFSAGFLVVSGWVLGNVAYLEHVYAAQSVSVTIPSPLPGRIVSGLYHAVTAWLPMAITLPFWGAAAVGAFVLFERGRDNPRGLQLNALLATALTAGIVFGAVSVMHKRSAAFVAPLLAVWCAVAADAIAARAGRRFVLAAALALFALDPVRLAIAWPASGPQTPTAGMVRLLRDAGAAQAPVFAFGSEPEIYAALGWPIVTPFFDWRTELTPLYEQHRGDPAGFVDALTEKGYGWLAFVAPQAGVPIAQQPYGGYVAQPLAADLDAIAADPQRFGLSAAGQTPVGDVRLYRIAAGAR